MATRLPSFIDGTDTGLGADHPLTALAGFYRAFNQRDLDAMARNWNDDDTVSMSNPLGGIARGWPAIRAVYGRIFAGSARVQVAFHDFTLHEAGDVFYVVGRERGALDKGSTHLDLAIRTTRLYRRVGDAWRQAHHHGSFEDAALLAAYGEVLQ